jgi:hypothetical protein
MTEHEARERWINELLRHEDVCVDNGAGQETGMCDEDDCKANIHDSRGPVIDAVNRYAAILALNLLEKHGDNALAIARLSVEFNELTSTDRG